MAYTVRQTKRFSAWHRGLGDLKARIAIARRIERASTGNFGDAKPVGGDVSEMRINLGPGYRVYFTLRGSEIVILLCGGDKKSQKRDIALATQLAKEV